MSNSDWNIGISFTAFHLKSGPENSFKPSVGFIYSGTKKHFFDFGMNLLIHAGNTDVIFGIKYIVPPEFANYFSFCCGILFHHGNEVKLFYE